MCIHVRPLIYSLAAKSQAEVPHAKQAELDLNPSSVLLQVSSVALLLPAKLG